MCFVFPKLLFLWVVTLYYHTLSYTFHTEVELVYKDLNKSIVKYNVYSMGVCVRAHTHTHTQTRPLTAAFYMITVSYNKYFITHKYDIQLIHVKGIL